MFNIQKNLNDLKAASEVLKNHPLNFKSIEDKNHLTIIFPAGYKLDGVRVSMANGKLLAYGKALDKMEQIWKGN